jgi:hypothetical protein
MWKHLVLANKSAAQIGMTTRDGVTTGKAIQDTPRYNSAKHLALTFRVTPGGQF